jgi:hypothetical protein
VAQRLFTSRVLDPVPLFRFSRFAAVRPVLRAA